MEKMMFKLVFLIPVFCLMLLPACMPTASSYESLRQEVLSLACNTSVRQDLERAIEGQRRILTEEQMIKSLQNMKQEIKCS